MPRTSFRSPPHPAGSVALLVLAVQLGGCDPASEPHASSRAAVIGVPPSSVGAEPVDFAWASTAPARTIRVSSGGTDQNAPDGTPCGGAGRPCATLDRAIALATPGTEIRLPGGTWSFDGIWSKSGTRTAPLFLRAEAGSLPVKLVPHRATPTATPTGPLRLGLVSFWVVEGLTIDCEDAALVGITISGSENVALRDSTIIRCGRSGVEIGPGGDGAGGLRVAQAILVAGNDISANRSTSNPPDSNGVTIRAGSHHVAIRHNVLARNSSDGVQCQGREQEQGTEPDGTPRALNTAWDPAHVAIEDNVINDNFEEGIDIKSCRNVTIRKNRIFDQNAVTYDEQRRCGGAALLLHFAARNVLVESNSISSVGGGISLGNQWLRTENVIVRRNLIYGVNQDVVAPIFVPPDVRNFPQQNCGDGITILRASNVDIYHNTLDSIPHTAFRVAPNPWYFDYQGDPCPPHELNPAVPCVVGDRSRSIRIWNNVASNVAAVKADGDPSDGGIDDDGGVLETWLENAPGLYVDSNHYSGPGGAPARFRLGRGTSSTAVAFAQRTLSAWRVATGLDGTSAEGSPSFAPDPEFLGYRLTQNSLAVNAAIVDEGNAGTDERCGAGPDRGAAESDCPTWTPPPADTAGPDLKWIRQYGATTAPDAGVAAAVDAARNAYVACTTSGGYGWQVIGGTDACIQSVDRFGAYRWARLTGSQGNDRATSVTTDAAGNVYLAGVVGGTIGGPAGAEDCFVAKYSGTGGQIWQMQFGTPSADGCTAIAAAGDGSLWVGGYTLGSVKPGIVNNGRRDVFVARIAPDRTVTYIDQFGREVQNEISGIIVSPGGDVFVSGSTWGYISLDGRATGSVFAFVARYLPIGTRAWKVDSQPVYGITSGGQRFAYNSYGGRLAWMDGRGERPDRVALAAAVAPGNEGFTWPYVQTLLVSNGSVEWLEYLPGTTYVDGIAADGAGNLYVAASTVSSLYGNIDFTYGDFDAVVFSVDESGDFRWGRQLGTGDDDHFVGVDVDRSGSVILVGTTHGELATANAGGGDFIIVKF